MELAKIQEELDQENAIVYAISNEGAEELKQMKQEHDLGDGFVFLSDPEGQAADLYAGKMENGVLKAATYVIGRDGTLKLSFVEDDYTKRPPAEDVLAAVRN